MRKFVALSLAAMMGVGAIAATSTAASAHSASYYGDGYHYRWGMPWHRVPLAYVYVNTPIFGFGIRTPYFHRAHEWNEHAAWCSARYRTYNPATDTYFKRRGVAARCISPDRW